MAKRLIVLFDGTWNTPDANSVDGDSSTNVFKFHQAILSVDASGMEQLKWYEPGVGTAWYDRFRGGAFGVGLSEKIQNGYKWLAKKYEDGDQVFVLGFSRGAYSARSLVGLIRNAGLLKPEHTKRVADAYALYRSRDEGADSENAVLFRREFSRDIPVHFLGVWDTVGALGIPFETFGWFNKRYYQFHDTELSGIVRNAFHAVAIDEHRENYQCTLWDPKEKPNQTVEQAWFSGAHANVGGGYANNNLSDIPLRWMMEKAQSCGLALSPARIPGPIEELPPIIDSYRNFLGGAYSRFKERYYRLIGATHHGQETISESVLRRTEIDQEYKPKNEVRSNLVGDIKPVGRIRR
ncbi:DUF2235 domain-containing protein [Zestomonas carbonaria]|uniref:T6SS Phospholipase effector Tle1-like catalytic domain-containing protein n=1 Tax=Zestomonas carbonaria TaxID=2762745 RepID=A0A7U7ENK6_9GAMM|nr:DUF2235 domain-containing protein [Pseudomonas carbonaria]CAD5108259.1 hypothetical protein PSEWESI4_02544 [Pseudomonas carbonaria]